MVYYAGWLFLVLISLWVSLVGFIWALRSGQFSDQERARFLPLGKDLLAEPIVAATRRKRKTHAIALLIILVIGLSAFAAALAVSVHHR